MGDEIKGFQHGILIGFALMIGSQMTLSFIENPATLNGVSLVLMAILVFLSAIMRPLKIYRKRKNDFSLPVDTEQNFKSDPASYNPFAHELSEFLASIRENRDPRPSGEDGLKALKIVSQIYDSAR